MFHILLFLVLLCVGCASTAKNNQNPASPDSPPAATDPSEDQALQEKVEKAYAAFGLAEEEYAIVKDVLEGETDDPAELENLLKIAKETLQQEREKRTQLLEKLTMAEEEGKEKTVGRIVEKLRDQRLAIEKAQQDIHRCTVLLDMARKLEEARKAKDTLLEESVKKQPPEPQTAKS